MILIVIVILCYHSTDRYCSYWCVVLGVYAVMLCCALHAIYAAFCYNNSTNLGTVDCVVCVPLCTYRDNNNTIIS